MASLADQRLARLHGQFLDAAVRFPTFHFAAVRAKDNSVGPKIEYGNEWRVGLQSHVWHDILRKPPGQQFAPVAVEFLWIGEMCWEGCHYEDGSLWDDVRAQFDHLQQALNLFRRLASQAVGNFTLPLNTPDGTFPGTLKRRGRWLGLVCAMDFVEEECRALDEKCWRVRTVPDDIFTASARAIEELQKASRTGAGDSKSGNCDPLPQVIAPKGLRATGANLEIGQLIRQDGEPADKPETSEGNAGKITSPVEAGPPPKSTGKKSTRGRKVDKATVRRADFAKPLREQGEKWPEIFSKYLKEHPRDVDATKDVIRRAFDRQYPELAASLRGSKATE